MARTLDNYEKFDVYRLETFSDPKKMRPLVYSTRISNVQMGFHGQKCKKLGLWKTLTDHAIPNCAGVKIITALVAFRSKSPMRIIAPRAL